MHVLDNGHRVPKSGCCICVNNPLNREIDRSKAIRLAFIFGGSPRNSPLPDKSTYIMLVSNGP